MATKHHHIGDSITLRRLGVAVHGDNWQRPLGRELGVSYSMLRRVSIGGMPMPDDLRRTLSIYVIKARAAAEIQYAERLSVIDEAARHFGRAA